MLSLRSAAQCAALAFLVLPAAFATDESKPAHRAWPHEASDLTLDGGVQFGQFENGLRYAWRKNAEPKERSYLWMHVDVGSLEEEESERGMAHFLEHMAFNGSEHFPPGKLVSWLQERGLEFGADTNAHTGFSETVYKLNLPSSDEKMLREGMLVLSDMAMRLDLTEEQIDAEKGVIDGEERERDSAMMRLSFKMLEEFLKGARAADRLPIGKKDKRDAFEAKSMRAFYERWYRPDNITVVLVGDLGTLDPLPLLKEYFGALKNPGTPLTPKPDYGKPTYERPYYALIEEEVPTASMVIGRMHEFQRKPFDKQQLVEDLPLSVACAMLNRRYGEATKSGKAPYLEASVGKQTIPDIADGMVLDLSSEPTRWKDALKAADLELRSALEFGFQDEELRIILADRLRGLDEGVRREATRSSAGMVDELVAMAEGTSFPVPAAAVRDILKPAYESITVESAKKALIESFQRGTFTLQALGRIDLGSDPVATLKAAYEESLKQKPTAPEKLEKAQFAYASNAEKTGKVKSRQTLEPAVEAITFENGVRAYLKKTTFKKREVLISTLVGEGELSSPRDATALRFVAGAAMNGAALEAHDEDQIRRLLAGRAVNFGFAVAEDAFSLSGSATNEDLLIALELISAQIAHCGWRTEGVDRLRRELPQQYEMISRQFQGPFALEYERKMYGDAAGFGIPPLDVLLDISMDDVRKWIEPQLKDGPITIALVGDLDIDATIASLARTLGTLPTRRAWSVDPTRLVAPSLAGGSHFEAKIDTKVNGALVTALFAADDGIEPLRRRTLHLVGRVLRDRVLVNIREKLGASYSPMATDDVSRVEPGFGRFLIQAEGDPGKTKELVAAVVDVAVELGRSGVTDEELTRIKEPLLKEVRDQQRQNRYWASILSGMHRNPNALSDSLSAENDFHVLDAKSISECAKKYLTAERAATLVVTPLHPVSQDPEKGQR